VKVYGGYTLNWNATIGAYAVAQSGQPWETHSYLPYAALTASTSNTDRYSEPAGSRRSLSQYQLDLNYTQQFPLMKEHRAVITAYLFNVFNSQTGYDIQPNFNAAGYGQPIRFLDPRRLEVTFKFVF
jgi:hypothetical protein